MRRTLVSAATVAAMAVGIGAIWATPAFATSAGCSIGAFSSSCTTGNITVDGDHVIRINVAGGYFVGNTWKLIEVGNGNPQVANGYIGSSAYDAKEVTGLFGTYKLVCNGGGSGSIAN